MTKTWICLLLILSATLCSAAWSMDEAVLTATKAQNEPAADKEFDDAMGIWFSHRYGEGAVLLKEFSKKHPDSRWAAEADLHVGCYLTFNGQYKDARPVFEKIIKDYGPKSRMGAKATIRLGNIAEREGKADEAAEHYSNALSMDLDWDQFRYANFRARKMIMTKGRQTARINCGPVALYACLEALGKAPQAASALQIKLGDEGMSMLDLVSQASLLGVSMEAVELPIEKLRDAPLPLIMHAAPHHFIAVLGIDGDKVHIADSIKGRHDETIAQLKEAWSGKALVFSSAPGLMAMSLVALADTVGGCCGQADEDECLGDPEECQQASDCPDNCGPGAPSRGAPTWWVNTVNLNLLARDTPIWYDPGRGPGISFTLTYSNENSNTGIFGRGWRSPYDMKVFFLPGEATHPTLQLHRANGKIETYVWSGSAYVPRTTAGGVNMASYGYDDKMEFTNQVPILTLRDGGKFYFVKENQPSEGRIQYIEDVAGKRVECRYGSSGNLEQVIDANLRATTIVTTGTGINERVTRVTIPDGRFAVFGYTAGNLTSITDMVDATSTFSYNALAWSGGETTSTNAAITASSPADGGSLQVSNASSFPASGWITVNGAESMWYSGKTQVSGQTYWTLDGIRRGTPALAAAVGSSVALKNLPYLSEIVTPSKKSRFTYEWWVEVGSSPRAVALHEAYECGPGESYPGTPTTHYSWCSTGYWTAVTRFPLSVTSGTAGCTPHWTGGVTTDYTVDQTTGYDASNGVYDKTGQTPVKIASYVYNATRDKVEVADAKEQKTRYQYDNHNVTAVADPTAPAGTWSRYYTYYTTSDYSNNKLHEEKDSSGNVIRAYTYNAAGQLTKVQARDNATSALYDELQNFYDAAGRLEHSTDALSQTTDFAYNEARGFLTAVTDPEDHVTQYHYDSKGRQDRVTDADGKSTRYEYDDLDRVTKVINNDDTYVETAYDCCHILWVKDENGSLTKYEYDGKSRLWLLIVAALDTTLTQDVASTRTDLPVASTAGFPLSGCVLLKSANGATVEIVSYTGITGNTLTGVVRGRLGTTPQSFVANAPVTQGTMASTVYDGIIQDRKTKTYDNASRETQYSYWPNGRLRRVTGPDGSWQESTYDLVGNVTVKTTGQGSTTISTLNYVYDGNDRLIGTY